jgi:Chalcone isomerase-like
MTHQHGFYRRLVGMMGAVSATALLHATAFATPSAKALPELHALEPAWQLHSQVRFRYWGVHAYDIALWMPPPVDPMRWQSQPVALSITYARQIAVNDLIDRTFTEMARQAKPTDAQAAKWRQAFAEAWQDVKANDRITAVYTPPSRLAFYFNGKASAKLDDAVLAPRFMGIWLSGKTSQTGLRQSLLQHQPALEVVHGW